MENKFTIKGMILDICSMRPHISRLLTSDKPYVPILEYLMTFDYYDDDNFIIPTAKMIETETGIKYGKIRNLLEMIYHEITTPYYESNLELNFSKIEVIFHLKGFRGNISFKTKQISCIPKVGDDISIPFFNEITGTTIFHISQVYHEIIGDLQQVNLFLAVGTFNSYLKIRKDLAFETGELNYFDTIDKTNYEIRDMLNIRPGKAW